MLENSIKPPEHGDLDELYHNCLGLSASSHAEKLSE